MSKQLEITYLVKDACISLTERDEKTNEEVSQQAWLGRDFHLVAEVWVHKGRIMIYPTKINTIEKFKEFIETGKLP